MKKILLILLLAFSFESVAQTEMPTQLGGFVLGSDVEQFQEGLRKKTTLPIRFMEALKG